jgi:hypothetical protein
MRHVGGTALAVWLGVGGVLAGPALGQVAGDGPRSAPVAVESTGGEWLVEQASRAGDVKRAPFGGRPALWLRNNTAAIRADTKLLDGTIEFDVLPMDAGDFFGVEFRRQRYGFQENVYFRVRDTVDFNALQYAPRINRSSTWQLYPEFNTAIAFPRNQWTHVRMEVVGVTLAIHLNGDPSPALRVERLRGEFGVGDVAFWARVNGRPTEWAAAVANVVITPRPPTGGPRRSVAPPSPGILAAWELSAPIPADSLPLQVVPDLSGWRPVEVEEGGLVNLNRVLGPGPGRWTAVARTTLRAAARVSIPLMLGYSDDVVVFLDGQPVYHGRNGWGSRYPGFLGLLQTGFETIHLTLRPGGNELLLAITDDLRFGWGFAARVPAEAPVDVIRAATGRPRRPADGR